MRSPDNGVTGANGREAGGSAPEPPEGSAGAHGSLMQRYRGAGAPPAGAEDTDHTEHSERSERSERGWGEGSGAWVPGGSANPPPPGPTTSAPGSPAPTTPPAQGAAHRSPAPTTTPARTAPASAAPTSTATGSTASSTLTGRSGLGGPAHEAGVRARSTPTLDADRVADFKRRWRDVQSDFVDDPRQAVKGADALTREVLDALTAMIADRQLVDGWKAGDGAGTENLRLALRQYRTLVDRLLEL